MFFKPSKYVLTFLATTMAGLSMFPIDIAAQTSRDYYVSDASYIVGTYTPKKTDGSPAAMANAAIDFLKSLNDSQRRLAKHPLNSPERREWTNLPPRPDAGGLNIGDLDDEQVKKACDLMAAIFSEQGYKKMCHIMLADDQLRSGGSRQRFGTDFFAIVVFGEPSATDPWAFQLDGHHIGVNLAFHGDKISMSPSFIGTQPEVFKIGDQNYRPFTGEIDDAYKLVNSLTDEQRKAAVLSPKRGMIITGPGADGKVPEAKGVSCKTFSAPQKELLLALIGQWANDLPGEHSKKEMERISAEIDQMHFSWNGALTARSDISYAIQSPSLIIEYSCQGAADKPLDHLHSMYRNPKDEYGGQLKDSK